MQSADLGEPLSPSQGAPQAAAAAHASTNALMPGMLRGNVSFDFKPDQCQTMPDNFKQASLKLCL